MTTDSSTLHRADEVVRQIEASSRGRDVLVLVDDEMAFARGGGGDGARRRRLYAVVADGASALTAGRWTESIESYLNRKGNGGDGGGGGKKGRTNRVRIFLLPPSSPGKDGSETGGDEATTATTTATKATSAATSAATTMPAVAEEFEVQVCEAARFVSELEKGGARIVELLEGRDYRYPNHPRGGGGGGTGAEGDSPARGEGGGTYAVHFESPTWRRLRERLGGRGLLYGLEHARSCVGMVRGVLKSRKAPSDAVARYVELLLERAARNDEVRNALMASSQRVAPDDGGGDGDGGAVEPPPVPRYGGDMEAFDAAAREAGKVMWAAIEGSFRNSIDEEGNRNLRRLAGYQIQFLADWFSSLRSESLRRWVADSRHCLTEDLTPDLAREKTCGSPNQLSDDAERLLRKLDVPVSADQVALLVRSGSNLFNLQTDQSDEDYSIVYITDTAQILSRKPPPVSHEAHVVCPTGFGGDKSGEVEYDAKELGKFVAECCKGNPRNIELLFSDPVNAIHASPEFLQLRAIRREFLTGRCLSQYYGFVSERLQRARKLLEDAGGSGGGGDARLSRDAEAAVSKLLDHAFHKLLGARSIAGYGEPVVRLPGDSPDRDFIMRIRTARPLTGELEPAKLLLRAEDMLSDTRRSQILHDRKREEAGEPVRTSEVDLDVVGAVLERIRLSRTALPPRPLAPPIPPPPPASPRRNRSVSSASRGDVSSVDAEADDSAAAVQRCLAEVEARRGIRIVFAAESSSRSIGTAHEGSDHDVAAIYVYPRDAYFSMVPLSRSFRESFPAGGDGGDGGAAAAADADADVDVDITLWEARHAFGLLATDNLTVLEAFSSPLVYRAFRSAPQGELGGGGMPAAPAPPSVRAADDLGTWEQEVLRLSHAACDRRRLARNALGQCESNFRSYIEGEGGGGGGVQQKRYVHVARRVLLLEWLLKKGEEDRWLPPLAVAELVWSLEEVPSRGESSDDGGEPSFGCLGSDVRTEIISMLRPEDRRLLREYGGRRPVLDFWITSRVALFKAELRKGDAGKQASNVKSSSNNPAALTKWDKLLIKLIKAASDF